MYIADLIPNEYSKQLLSNEKLPEFSKGTKKKLTKDFDKRIELLFREFYKIKVSDLNNDLIILNGPNLEVTEYDKECTQYGLSTLNLRTTYQELNKLLYNEIHTTVTLIDGAIEWFQYRKRNIDLEDIYTKKIIVAEIERKLSYICRYKNMYDYYHQRVSGARDELKLLRKYIKALTVC